MPVSVPSAAKASVERSSASRSPISAVRSKPLDSASLPPVLVPSEPPSPDRVYEQTETRERMRKALALLPPRERRIVSLYYFGDATMKQIGQEIGVNESRVSQLHARAIQRLRKILSVPAPEAAAPAPKLVARTTRPRFTHQPAAKVAATVRRVGDTRRVA